MQPHTVYHCAFILQNKAGISVTICYEDLAENPQSALLPVFEVLGIAANEMANCLTAMNRDSQEGVFGRATKLRGSSFPPHLAGITQKLFNIYRLNLNYDASLDEFKRFLDQ